MARRRPPAGPSLFDPNSGAPVADRDFAREMETSYLEYSMSVIVSRALPDVRDGLKPVQRRILWGMQSSGVRSDGPYRKCAKVVGEVMGAYHPHGDQAIYDALVRMAQPHSSYVPLVDGQGNFGSPGYPPAAMRYTECRLTPTAARLLEGIGEDTVDFIPNYDGSETEPTVLPAAFPNLLVNGASGIAVGMATNIPSHNAKEAIEAALVVLDDAEVNVRKVMRKLKGPDFPSGCDILDPGGDGGIAAAYTDGYGRVTCRAQVEAEDAGRGTTKLTFRNLPPSVAPSAICEQVVDRVKKGKLASISDIVDASAKGEQVLEVWVKKGHSATATIAELYAQTKLEDTFGINLRVLVDSVPKVCGVVEILTHFCDHRMEVVLRRSRFRRDKAEKRRHIVVALIKALDDIDRVIATIRAANDVAEAKANLQTLLDIDEVQATAIVDMQLRRLTALEIQSLRDELVELDTLIAELTRIIDDEGVRRGVVRDELTELRDAYKDVKRRCRIVSADELAEEADAAVEAEVAVDVQVRVLRGGWVEITPPESRRATWRGGDANHAPIADLTMPSNGRLAVITDDGRSWAVSLLDVAHGRRVLLADLSDAARAAKVLCAFPAPQVPAVTAGTPADGEAEGAAPAEAGSAGGVSRSLLLATSDGKCKRLAIADAIASRRDGLLIMKLDDGARLAAAVAVADAEPVVFVASTGTALRTPAADVPLQGRTAGGVRAMRLDEGATLVAAAAAIDERHLVVASTGGFSATAALRELHEHGRGGKGVTVLKTTPARGGVVAAVVCEKRQQVHLVDDANKVHSFEASAAGRSPNGKQQADSAADLFC